MSNGLAIPTMANTDTITIKPSDALSTETVINPTTTESEATKPVRSSKQAAHRLTAPGRNPAIQGDDQ